MEWKSTISTYPNMQLQIYYKIDFPHVVIKTTWETNDNICVKNMVKVYRIILQIF